jgi:hypothetical protein
MDINKVGLTPFTVLGIRASRYVSLELAKPEHEVLYQDLCKLVGKYGDKINALEMLAIAANMIGKLIAMQDHRKVTREMALDIVVKNLEYGNQQVLEQLSQPKALHDFI